MYQCFAREILKHKFHNGINGLVGVIGKYTPIMDITNHSLKALLNEFNLPSDLILNDYKSIENDNVLFSHLGFDNVESIDFSDHEEANHIVDMNYPLNNGNLFNRYDLLINNGTLEHVFSASNCLINMSKLVKPEGYILHFAPLNNWVDHGFYQISPTLLIDYYLENGFSCINGNIFEYVFTTNKDSCSINYISFMNTENYNTLHFPFSSIEGAFGSGLYGYTLLAKKHLKSTAEKIPTQSSYESFHILQKRKESLYGSWRNY